MRRSITVLLTALLWTCCCESLRADAPDADAIIKEASRLEVELGKYKDTSPEAADTLVKLVDLYYANGRVFDLVRAGQRFSNAHPADPRHKAIMLKMIDGLQALSRNAELAAACRQFIERYADDAAVVGIELRLIDALERTEERARVAQACRAFWQRRPAEPTAQRCAARALVRFESLHTAEGRQATAELAGEMVARLPAGPLAAEAGWRGFNALVEAGQPAAANVFGGTLLTKALITDPQRLRELHLRMAAGYANLRQHANAAESLRNARKIKDGPEVLGQLILQLAAGGSPPTTIEPLVDEYVKRYPDRVDAYDYVGCLAQAHLAAKEKEKALARFVSMLPHDAISRNAAWNVVALNGTEPDKLKEPERLLRDAIAKNEAQADYLTYILATELYEARFKDPAKARDTIRKRLLNAKNCDRYTIQNAQWLLSTAPSEEEFQADVERLAALRNSNYEQSSWRDFATQCLRAVPNNKKKGWHNIAVEAFKKPPTDPIAAAWLSQRSLGGATVDDEVRERLLEPAQFDRLPKSLKYTLLMKEADRLRSGPKGPKTGYLAVLDRLVKLFPDDYSVAARRLAAAIDFGESAEVKAAALHLLQLPATGADGDTCARLIKFAADSKDPKLAKQAYAWTGKALPDGILFLYAARIGDALTAAGMTAEAVEVWTKCVAAAPEEAAAFDCAARLRQRLEGAERTALVRKLAAAQSRFRGRYLTWLADEHLTAAQWDDFTKVLREASAAAQADPFHDADFDVPTLQAWVAACRAGKLRDQELSEAQRLRILTAVRDMGAGVNSAMAQLMTLQPTSAGQTPIQRLLICQAATQLAGSDATAWDRLLPTAVALMENKDYAAAATVLTGLLANSPNTTADKKDRARSLTAQCYAKIGMVGMTIDEKSPVAPLLRAALYLRLGDEPLAFETFVEHRALFRQRRNEVPPELLIFVCERLIAAAGDENLGEVETYLREWLMRSSDSQQIEESLKAQVQLLLARGYFKAQRYDVARAEFNTLINRYPKTPQSLEAEFGIGESFLAQKIYDQALAVFEKLGASRNMEIVVRAEFLRGVVAFQRGETDEARTIFRSVLDRVPNVELANQALFKLAEVYGLEQRYLDQLTLLRTVGRLGRSSKRTHVPGQALSIVVYDSDLGISRGQNRIPVTVTTMPGGDVETVYLTGTGAGKGLFRADVDTKLGDAVVGNKVLELTGQDKILCDYPEEFKAQFRRVPLSDVHILIAADATLEVASSKIFEKKRETFSENLARESEQPSAEVDSRVSEARPGNQIKPGNPIYIRVIDLDRDLTKERDEVVVKLTAESGDQVQARLKETGSHTGIFEGTVATGELSAWATATDAAIDHSPLMAIDLDPATYWQSKPDGVTPKALTIDMKDLRRVARLKVAVPDATQRAPVRADLQGSYDGTFWFRLAGHPAVETAAPLPGGFSQMKRRVYAGNFAKLTDWRQVVEMVQHAKVLDEVPVHDLSWTRPEDDSPQRTSAVVFQGKFIQPREGAVRLEIGGALTALVVDGRLELPVGPGGRSIDLWLTAGAHDLTVFSAPSATQRSMTATRARASLSSAKVALQPFEASDFDLNQPAAKKDAVASDRPSSTTRTANLWDFRFPSVDLRYVRLVVHEYLGDAVAIGQVEILGEKDEKYVPPQTDVLALASNQILEMAGGDQITVSYTDELIAGNSGRSRLLSSNLQATYFNASIAPITYDFEKTRRGEVTTHPRRLLRVDPGERIVVQIRDYDEDRTNQADTVPFEILINDGQPIPLTALETEPNSGVFTREINTSAKDEKDHVTIKPGDRIYCRYIDHQNTFPGHAVPRETVVLVAEPTEGRVRIVDNAATKPGQVAHVAVNSPLTIEVIDPDAAKNADSSVLVDLATSEGAKAQVRCVLASHSGAGQEDALTAGRFVGQIILQLGGKASPELVPRTSDMSRRLLGGPVVEEADSAMVRVLNITGKDLITVTYHDGRNPTGQPSDPIAQARLVANGQLVCTDRDYEKPIERVYVGERMFLKVTDPDQDTSDARDSVQVELTCTNGEREIVTLEETLEHSGVFAGSLQLIAAEKATPDNLKPTDPQLEVFFGAKIHVRYEDRAAATESGRSESACDVPVVVGTNSILAVFSKTFGNDKLAAETKFTIAESHFELFKSHRNLAHKEQATADLEAGKRVLREVIDDYPDPKYAPRVAYLLGQFAQELEQWSEAIAAYQVILRQYPEHFLAADAQYKVAQCYEQSGDFDQALEAYVTLAATYPKSPLNASVMIRIADHFYKKEEYDVAARVGEKFLEKFAAHQHAPLMAFRVGQCLYKGTKYAEAGKAFDRFVKTFEEDKLCADVLFWAGESYRQGGDQAQAFQRYNRCRWDFPSSDAAKYARGRLALPDMIQQFESDNNSLNKTPNSKE